MVPYLTLACAVTAVAAGLVAALHLARERPGRVVGPAYAVVLASVLAVANEVTETPRLELVAGWSVVLGLSALMLALGWRAKRREEKAE